MTLLEIKSKVVLKGWTMRNLSEKLGCSTRWMYKKIENSDKEFIERIEKILF